jgi:fructokinase
MILVIGEILADMIGEKTDGALTFKAFCGGAPFNVAVGAHNAGAKVSFTGRVGDDPIGRFVLAEAQKANLADLNIQVDGVRNTTIAFVTLTDGERDFAFNRHDTADFHIDADGIDFSKEEISIVHLGSLMLSESNGKILAKTVADKAQEAGKILSFDLNFRSDTYENFDDALRAYAPFVARANIVKFSDDELRLYTGRVNVEEGIKALDRPDALILVTMGSNGSAYFYGDMHGIIPTEKVKPVDTTGAGDAFFGTFLAQMENKSWTKENIENALVFANKAGAEATQFLGAIRLDS